ncbi:MAG: Iron-sulfur cluster insertion protein ErpA [Chlamydiia bacterium]|nr:Iron-sulfur cluster insertion protein ErpA [Chlamydiia bacterium]
MGEIDRSMTVGEIFENHPMHAQKIANELMKIGLNCVGCGASTHETLEAGMYLHGKEESEIEDLVDVLNQIIKQKVDTSTITLTKRAADKFLAICETEDKKGSFLRFGDKLGGCSGFEYYLDFTLEKDDKDQLFHQHGVDIVVDKTSLSRLIGCEIDYLDGLNASGFKISNPNAKSSCSCGNSQSY